MRPIISLCAVFMLLSSTVSAETTLISGTYRKGANANEPQPVKTKYLKTVVAGFGITDSGVKYVLNVEIIRPFKRKMFVRAEFQNPAGQPFIEEAEIPAGQRGLQIVHGPVKGLQVFKTYTVEVTLYEANDRSKPVDTLKQDIKSYADSTGEEIIFKTASPVKAKKAKRRF